MHMITYTAKFVKAEHARAFFERLSEDLNGWWIVDGTLKLNRTGGRIVTWEGQASSEYWADMAETVGYYGSPPEGPVATLNGIRTPRSW